MCLCVRACVLCAVKGGGANKCPTWSASVWALFRPPNHPPPTLLCDISAELISQHLLMTFPNLADLLTLPRLGLLPSLGSSQNNNSTHFVMHMHMHISIYLCTYPHIGLSGPTRHTTNGRR